MSSLVEVFCYKGASVFIDVGAMLVETCFELVFGFANILAVVAFVTIEQVYDVFCFTCERVSNMKCFLGLHAFECRSLDEMVGANGACFVAFEAARGAGFGSREDGGHEK